MEKKVDCLFTELEEIFSSRQNEINDIFHDETQ